jgi:hypothetical protein
VPCVRRSDRGRVVVDEPAETIIVDLVIRKLKSGNYRLYSRKKDPKTGKRRNLGTFKTEAAAKKHEKAVEYFKRR